MALPIAAPHRQLRHRRSIDVQAFDRGDGTWELDARLTDTKTGAKVLHTEVRPAGVPIHDMLLRLVIDEKMQILEAGSQMLSMPYPGMCDEHPSSEPDPYQRLVGLNLRQGFRDAVWERLGGERGCTHITELSQLLPTAAIQAFAGDVYPVTGTDSETRPFQVGRCHGLRLDGEAVRVYYPRWYRSPAPGPESG